MNTPNEWLDSIGISIPLTYIDLNNQDDIAKFKRPCECSDIIVYSDEWNNNRSQIESILKSKAGIFEKRIGARDCTSKEIVKSEARQFLDSFHIQQSNLLGIVYFGLYHENELMAVMSLGRHSRQTADNIIVLDRLCFRSGVQIIGGASKLFSKCVKWAKNVSYDKIISFSDNRISDGKVYINLNFELEKEHSPDYFYYDPSSQQRLSKQSQKKSSSKCPEGMTEFEWSSYRGLIRLYDCGKKRWAFQLDPNKPSWNDNLSKKCAEQHADGVFKHSHIRGYFYSNKNKSYVYYSSSYELRCLFLLEQDSTVKSFKRCEVFKGENSWRNPDLKVEKNEVEIWEIKPEKWLKYEAVKRQIADSEKYALDNGFIFKLWTEQDSGLDGEKAIIDWAKQYLIDTNADTAFIEQSKEAIRRKSKKYYDKHIASDKVEVYCDYCQKIHTPLRLTYEKNIRDHDGTYICEKHGGHIAGSKPKPHKVNPYLSDGKKECNECKGVLLFENFSPKKGGDGYMAKCKECRAKINNERYHQKRLNKPIH